MGLVENLLILLASTPVLLIKKIIESIKYAILITRETYQFNLQFALATKLEMVVGEAEKERR
jgi:hypothetical protein